MLLRRSTRHIIHSEMKEEIRKIHLWKVDVQAEPETKNRSQPARERWVREPTKAKPQGSKSTLLEAHVRGRV